LKQIRRHLTYANVMSSIAVFVLLGGAAVAASQLPKKSVGPKQLKNNAVTTAKIKKNAVTKAKIKKGAVDNSKLADGSVTNNKIADNAVTGNKVADGSLSGADINANSTSFSQVIAEIRATNQSPIATGSLYPFNNPTYTQNGGEDNQYIGALDVNFGAGCNAPRTVVAYLLVDPANPATPTANDLAGYAAVTDNNAGSVNRRGEFVPLVGGTGMAKFAPPGNTQHTFYVYVATASCNTGSGISATGAGVDVIGTK
jgi:hypothetical protein